MLEHTDEGSNTRNESTHASENQSRKGSLEINEIFQTFENSNSFGNVNYPPGCRSVTNEDISKLKEIWEYVLNLSTLIVELQNFPASKVAAAWLLASRKIMKIHPLWNKNMENV